MNIICGKQHIDKSKASQIVELFNSNYYKYHYMQLCTYEGIRKLLDRDDFNCVLLIDKDKVCGFAGYYQKKEVDDIVSHFWLAHLLVDSNCRGKGYGSILENSRLKMIQDLNVPKVICASCVEHPNNSILMKQNRGFYVAGFRYCYRPGRKEREHAVVMVYLDNLHNEISIDTPHIYSKKLIKTGNPYAKFQKKSDRTDFSLNKTNTIEINNDLLGRSICCLQGSIDGTEFDLSYLNQLKTKNAFAQVCLSPGIMRFSNIDKLLISNSFYPLCYIPNIRNGFGMIEYQYLSNGIMGLVNDKTISKTGLDFLNILIH